LTLVAIARRVVFSAPDGPRLDLRVGFDPEGKRPEDRAPLERFVGRSGGSGSRLGGHFFLVFVMFLVGGRLVRPRARTFGVGPIGAAVRGRRLAAFRVYARWRFVFGGGERCLRGDRDQHPCPADCENETQPAHAHPLWVRVFIAPNMAFLLSGTSTP